MTYYTLGLGTTDPGRFHVWDDEGADWVEPPEDHIPDHADPVGPPLCGSDDYHSGTALDPITERADSLRAFIRGTDHEVCPGCYLALERRHALPESYRTDTLTERIHEYQADQTTLTVPPGSTEASVIEQAREMIEDLKRSGGDLSEMTLRMDPETHEALREEASWGATTRKMGVVESLDGVPVMEDPTAGGLDLSAGGIDPPTYESYTFDIEVEPLDLSVTDLDLSIDTSAMDEAVRAMAERAEDAAKEAVPSHPSCRSPFVPFPVKHLPDFMDAAPVTGEYPGVAGVTKDADTWCLDCALDRDWVDFEPEPTQPDVSLVLRDSEWDYIPRCGSCERPLDVPSTYSGWDAAGTFTGTCVQRRPLVLDDGFETVRVRDLGWLDGEDPQLGAEYEAPITALTPAGDEDS